MNAYEATLATNRQLRTRTWGSIKVTQKFAPHALVSASATVAVELFCGRCAVREPDAAGVGSAVPFRFTSGTTTPPVRDALTLPELWPFELVIDASFHETEDLAGAFPLSSSSCTAPGVPKVALEPSECLD